MKRKARRVQLKPINTLTRRSEKADLSDNGLGTTVPPSFVNVEIYFDQQGLAEDAKMFYQEYNSRQWKSSSGRLIANWKVCASEWIYNYQQELKRQFRKSPFYCNYFY